MNVYRQGDVLIRQTEKNPDSLEKSENTILAYGDLADHKHQLCREDVNVFLGGGGDSHFSVKSGTAVLLHEEHADILEWGDYEMWIQRSR
ncbi:MAG: hypothetical protein JNJ47_06960 [Alphaproteobacteria bacterium]|nr:hypothetical protein [Alphaproteobacteria bacterium]